MPIRLRKSIKVAPGTRINISKKGVSASVGAGGVSYSTGKSGNCLYYIFVWPFVAIYQLYVWLFKGLWIGIKWVVERAALGTKGISDFIKARSNK